MRIYRAEPTERHLLWVVTSLLSQARAAKDAATEQEGDSSVAPPATVPGAQLLTLAEGMLKRAADGGSLKTQAGLSVYLSVLAALNRHADATALACSPLATTCIAIESERRRCVAQLAAVSGEWRIALDANEALLKANPDDWLAFLGAVDATVALAGVALPDTSAGAQGIDAAVAVAAADAVASLASKLAHAAGEAGGPKTVGRGPWLALVEAAHRRVQLLKRASDHASSLSDAAEALGTAVALNWTQFGDSPSAAADLALYARALRNQPSGVSALCNALASHAPIDGCVLSKKEDADRALRRAASAMALRIDCGAVDAMPVADVCREARALATAARDAGSLICNVIDIREGTSGDGCFFMAAEALATRAIAGAVAASPQTCCSDADATSLLLSALLFAHEGSAVSMHAAPLRVMMTAIYGLLGAADAAANTLEALKLRHVQHESLAHLVHPPYLCSCASPEAFQKNLAMITSLHDSHLGTSGGAGDMAVTALTKGSADQALDFDAFAKRLRDSHARAVTQVEKQLEAVVVASATSAGSVALQKAQPQEAASALVTPAAVARMRFNGDDGVNPRVLALPSGGWHCAVADWWSACTTASPAHEWPCTRPVTASLRGPAHEGGGVKQRSRSAAALVLRASLVSALAAASVGDTAQLRAIAARAAEAGQKLVQHGGRLLASDAVTMHVLTACVHVTSTAKSEASADDPGVGSITAWIASLRAAVTGAVQALNAGRFPGDGNTLGLPLAGGAINIASAALTTAVGVSCAVLAAWAQPTSGVGQHKKQMHETFVALRDLTLAINEGAVTLGNALRATSLAHAEDKQLGALRSVLEALPVCKGAPRATIDAVSSALVTSHREAAERLVDRATGFAVAAVQHEARLQKAIVATK